jgi:DNA-binding NarL/FixJ family response regulator
MSDERPPAFRTPHSPIRILVVADYPLARAGLAALLGGFDDLLVVGQAAGAAAWSADVDGLAPDVVVLDLAADDEEGLERLARGLAARPALAGVVLAAGGGDGDGLAEALGAGVRAYLPREAGGEELAAAIRAATAGLLVLHPAPAAPLLERLLDRPRPLAGDGPAEPLTPRELEVVQALAGGLTNRAIARRLGVSENTVKFHVSSILTKLDAASRAEAVALAARRGLLLF